MHMRVLDLFSGIGSFSLGLERAGMETAAFCEQDKSCQALLARHWPEVPIYDDVQTLTKERLDADGIGNIDVICGGFPCQDLSEAGHRAGIDGARSGLWVEYVRLIGEIRPNYVIVENVANLLAGPSEQRGQWFGRVLGDLAKLRFDAWWSRLRACDIGAPHIRNRVWALAYPEGLEAGCAAARNCHQKFAAARAVEASQVGGCSRNYGRQDWHPEPAICRVDAGTSANVDRIAALGNTNPPQIPEMIGRAIMEAAQ